jgi:hypothetical protein
MRLDVAGNSRLPLGLAPLLAREKILANQDH